MVMVNTFGHLMVSVICITVTSVILIVSMALTLNTVRVVLGSKSKQ